MNIGGDGRSVVIFVVVFIVVVVVVEGTTERLDVDGFVAVVVFIVVVIVIFAIAVEAVEVSWFGPTIIARREGSIS